MSKKKNKSKALPKNRIYNENCLDGMKKIEDASVDFICCDLPYQTTKCKWDVTLTFFSLIVIIKSAYTHLGIPLPHCLSI